MKVAALRQPDLFDKLRPEWNALLHRSQSDKIFSTWEWQSIWWSVYQPGKLWVLECRDDSNQLVGLAPWFIQEQPLHGRVVRGIGCVDVTDYLDVIVDSSCQQAVIDCMARYVSEHRDEFNNIDLCNLPENSIAYTQLAPALQAHGFALDLIQQEVCPIILLPPTWDEYLELLDKKQRHELKRKLRRAESAVEKINWYLVGTEHDLDTELNRFLDLMAASHPSKAEFLTDPHNVDFFRRMSHAVFQNGWLQLSFLTIDGVAAAAYLNFIYRDHVLVYNSGLKIDTYGHLSPGIVLLAHNIRLAVEQGYRVFDFLRGNEVYKYRMGGQDTRIFMLMTQKNSPELGVIR